MRFKAIGWVGVESVRLVEGMDKWLAVVNTVMNPRVPQNSDNCLT
jgi:hypothetical protein